MVSKAGLVHLWSVGGKVSKVGRGSIAFQVQISWGESSNLAKMLVTHFNEIEEVLHIVMKTQYGEIMISSLEALL